jgi:hypothetical protein
MQSLWILYKCRRHWLLLPLCALWTQRRKGTWRWHGEPLPEILLVLLRLCLWFGAWAYKNRHSWDIWSPNPARLFGKPRNQCWLPHRHNSIYWQLCSVPRIPWAQRPWCDQPNQANWLCVGTCHKHFCSSSCNSGSRPGRNDKVVQSRVSWSF